MRKTTFSKFSPIYFYCNFLLKRIIKNTLAALTVKEKRQFFFLVLCNMVISIADIAALALLVFMIGIYTKANLPDIPDIISSRLPDRRSILPFLFLFIFFALKNYAGYLSNKGQCRFMVRVASRISQNKLLQYLKGDYTNYIHKNSSIHIRETGFYPTEFSQHILNGFQQIVAQSVLVLLTITGILLFNVKLFLLLFLVLLPPVIIIFYQVRKRSNIINTRAKQSNEKSLQYLQEALSGFVESNLYHKINFFLKRYSTRQYTFNKSISDYLVLQELPNRVIEIIALLGLFLLIVFARWSGNNDGNTLILIGAFMAAAYKMIPGVVKILNISGQINAYAFTIDNLSKRESILPEKQVNPSETIRSLRFENVHFSYNGQALLKGLDLHIEQGDFLGISGPSGKGKTTILNLLLGFLTPHAGKIFINENRTSTHTRKQYHRHISYVKQQPFLIRGSLLQNIVLDEKYDDDHRLEQALEAAGIWDMIKECPEGLDKKISENGKNISGGQRQRIALARALYKDAPLFVLDEPFSELDQRSENLLLHHLQCLSKKNKLVILVTHNDNSLSFCNKIISLHDG